MPTDVFTHAEVIIMGRDSKAAAAVDVPKLRETWIQIDIGPAPNACGYRLDIQVAANVHKQRRGFRDIQQATECDALQGAQFWRNQRHPSLETKFFRDVPEICSVDGI